MQGPWLSKKDIGTVIWLVKSWSSETDSRSSSATTDSSTSVSALEFRRCLTMTVALNFDGKAVRLPSLFS